jgi:hypothetical protein
MNDATLPIHHPDDLWSVRPTTPDEIANNIPYVTSSMIEAVNTCPKWGIIHNVHNRHFVTGYRQMALEAGSLMHDILAVLNFYQVGIVQQLPDHMRHHAQNHLGKDRWSYITTQDKPFAATTEQLTLERLMYNAIASSDYYDDPNDKVRTLSNLEHCGLELVTYWLMNFNNKNIYVSNPDNPTAPIGIEMSLDVVFSWQGHSLRFIGMIDSLFKHAVTGRVTPGDYKTTANMNDAWREALKTRHQFSAYWGALHAYFEPSDISDNFLVIGTSIPVRKTSMPNIHLPIYRDYYTVLDFLKTAMFSLDIIDRFRDIPTQAPMFTHSCSRYFRPCSLIDLCASSPDDQEVMFDQMKIAPTLSPSEQKALTRKD